MRNSWRASASMSIAATLVVGGTLLAQGVLVQLGLTETAARNYLLGEIKSPATGRRSAIVVAGTRGFLKLPAAARGPAASGLFAWAKAYVNSPAFKTAYATHRKQAIPQYTQDPTTVEEAVKAQLEQQQAMIDQFRKSAGSMPPADAQKLLATAQQMEADLRNPERLKTTRAVIEAERAEKKQKDSANIQTYDDSLPADPQKLFARRLREFLDATADVNFSTRTISLTGGPDGIEFVDPPDRTKSWVWQEAVIVGQEAASAARVAARAWLKEIER